MRRAKGGKKIQNTIRTGGFAKAFCLFAGKNAPKVCGLYLARQTHAPAKTSIGMLCFTVRRALLTTTICGQQPRRYAFWAARRGKNAARNATSAQKTQPCAAFEDKGFTRLQQKTFRRALSFDLTGEIAYNLCITTCGVRRKNKGVTVC